MSAPYATTFRVLPVAAASYSACRQNNHVVAVAVSRASAHATSDSQVLKQIGTFCAGG
jgi:hypothetical protein